MEYSSPQAAGRLLPCGGVDEWIHVNCALWSAEVYEDNSGLLYCVHTAISRGLRLVRAGGGGGRSGKERREERGQRRVYRVEEGER